MNDGLPQPLARQQTRLWLGCLLPFWLVESFFTCSMPFTDGMTQRSRRGTLRQYDGGAEKLAGSLDLSGKQR